MNLSLLLRLVRVQFVPIIMMPVLLGAAIAWNVSRGFQPFFLLIALAGTVSLHIASNAIDDVFDYANGVDAVSDRMFPRDSPGWKPLPRGMVSPGEGYAVAFLFYILSIGAGVYLSVMVGWWALAIAAPGIVLSWLYTAPPFKLAYRGIGLGELSVMLSFGPLPALGTYYVITGHLSSVPLLASIPTGLLTACVLIAHDLIFYEPYRTSGKVSLAVRLGQASTARFLAALSMLSYGLVALLVVVGMLPSGALIVFLVLPLSLKLADFRGRVRSPPEYGSRTLLTFVQSVAFTGLLALGLAFL
jgi:1,4-dihydroxy-2-naphthoate octaprenyltransferase